MIPKPVQTGCDDGLEPVACRRFRLSPARIITLSFALMILMGTILLSLPIASQDGKSVGFLDALFTATSANCVTGLVVVNTFAHWTAFGKAVILGLIQLGGLGLVTVLTIFSVLLHRRISLENRIIIQASFNQDSFCGMVRLVRSVVFITLIMEMAGALILTISFFFSRWLFPSTGFPQRGFSFNFSILQRGL